MGHLVGDIAKSLLTYLLEIPKEASLTSESIENGRKVENSRASVGQQENRQAIADRMEALAIELRSISDEEMQTVPTDATLLALAGKIYSARRKVDEIFDMAGFSVSPAWDIMLDLYKGRASGRQISVTSASIGAACPATTALRWLQALETRGLIQRQEDEHDRRRTEIVLTDAAMIKVAKALQVYL
jgi:hypothetical protein